MGYGTGQRVAFAGLVIGFLLCLGGCIAPYWQYGKLNINEAAKIIDMTIPFIGDITIADMHGGLWWYCVTIMENSECKVQDILAKGWYIRLASVINVLLALLCASTALCRTCCCKGGKTICHGIMAFIAGCAGITAIGFFASDASDSFEMKLDLVQFGWAFYLYIAGSAIITVVSFMLCFASPDNPVTGMIISSVGGVFPAARYARMTDNVEHMANGTRDTEQIVNFYPRA